jgi:hypothetical protein
MQNAHSFHIPVMGIGFTLETPIKVAPYGMASAMSLVDDMLIERLRKLYSEKFNLPYQEITDMMEDFRARRITSYLDLVHDIAKRKFEDMKLAAHDRAEDLRNYIRMLPNGESLLAEFNEMKKRIPSKTDLENWLKDKFSLGSIDVNIMTKVDKVNYKDGNALDAKYNDAHAAMRGYAESKLNSSLILSAGMNPRLYGYLANFPDFFPDEQGNFKKQIVLKVSDYRSAIIQGKFLAKKGLWVSEYRVESGLNCGGHAFATDGYLMGPVLQEFREKRNELIESTFDILAKALENLGHEVPSKLPIRITAQGGIGTAEEHEFLMQEYQLDSIGWGSPFLLVPEATTIDDRTLNQLAEAKEKDIYLSGISPLGVLFNNLRGNSKDQQRDDKIEKGRPGSSCPKKYVSINNEFTDKNICTASREYQHQKIKQLQEKQLSKDEFQKAYDKIVEKSCICVGLGTGTLLDHNLDTKVEGKGVSVCPGPNMAYFSRIMELDEITDHIYGRNNVIDRDDRPNLFVKELNIYLDYLKSLIDEFLEDSQAKQKILIQKMIKNLREGIAYYQELFSGKLTQFKKDTKRIKQALQTASLRLDHLEKMIIN